MDEKKNTSVTEQEVQSPAPSKPAESEVEMICLPAHPPKTKSKEDVANAKRIANRYLGIPALEKIVKEKKARQQKKAAAIRFKVPETPDEFYDRGQKYLTGAHCAVPFQEQAAYYQKAADMFAGAGDFHDAPHLAEHCRSLANSTLAEGYQTAYRDAVALKEHAITRDDWFAAARAFERISGYEQADQLAEECEHRLAQLNSAKRPLLLIALILIAALCFAGVRVVQSNAFRYQAARIIATMGFDSAAYSLLEGLDSYKNSAEAMAEIRYHQGVTKMKKGNYSGAAKAFADCSGYSDSQSLMEECYYQAGAAELDEGSFQKALSYLAKSNGYPGTEELRYQAELALIQDANPGDTVVFGTADYILLDRLDDSALLLSSKLYGESAYHSTLEDVDWAGSDMRAVLNGDDYLNEKFSEEEQALIQLVQTSENTEDKVFLLSREEYETYQSVMGSKDALWWLRDNGATSDSAVFVSCDGTIMEAGYPVNSPAIQGRAALWINLPME